MSQVLVHDGIGQIRTTPLEVCRIDITGRPTATLLPHRRFRPTERAPHGLYVTAKSILDAEIIAFAAATAKGRLRLSGPGPRHATAAAAPVRHGLVVGARGAGGVGSS